MVVKSGHGVTIARIFRDDESLKTADGPRQTLDTFRLRLEERRDDWALLVLCAAHVLKAAGDADWRSFAAVAPALLDGRALKGIPIMDSIFLATGDAGHPDSVDRIRRQKADLEDVLVRVHGETPEQARFRAGLTNPQERDAILAEYEAMEKKPLFTPWQVAVSEALRDGEAEKAIEAWHLRNRLHLCHDEAKTLTRLVNDWERHVRAQPDASTVVLARTNAEGRALSWLMRQRVLAQTPDAKRAVIEVSRDLDGKVTEPLEIAVGDRIRIGATQWEKQLFNGTVVTVEDLEVRRAYATAVSRKARNAVSSGRRPEANADRAEPEFAVHITARTDDGRRVTFRHDEVRDWHDNIRLDYGYAMTIASAQGLTVDRAFLLADDRPARETIYPAATRHREGLDVYVNRSPLVFDIAERRPED